MKTRALVLGGSIALGLLASAAYAAGFLTNGLPPAGGTQFPTTLPFTGSETIPLDTNLSGGASPQSESASLSQLGTYFGSGGGNSLIGGDFTTNLFQRGTTSVSTTTVLKYGPDRWWGLSGTGTAFTMIKETGASTIGTGFGASTRVIRTASQTGVLPVCFGQVLNTAESLRFAGQTAEFSASLQAGALFSAANSTATMTIGYSVAGSADQTAANFSTGSWTGQVNTSQAQILTTSYQRFSVVAAVPTTATQIGVKICYTPVGTAGATDYFEVGLAQLTVNASGVNCTNVSGSACNARAFSYRPQQDDILRQYAYYYALTEPAASISVGPPGQGASTTTCILSIPLPTRMRAAPALEALGTALGTSTWTITHVVTNTALASTYLVDTTGGSTVNSFNITATVASGLTAGQTCTLTGAGGGSVVGANSEL